MRRPLVRIAGSIFRILWLSGFLAGTLAQATEHHGQVMFGGIAVPGATVNVTQGAKHLSTVTDQQGLYEFADLPDGIWNIRIEMRGFTAIDSTVKVAADAPQGSFELTMLPLDAMIAEIPLSSAVPGTR